MKNNLDDFGTNIDSSPQATAPRRHYDDEVRHRDDEDSGGSKREKFGNTQWTANEAGVFVAVPSTRAQLPAGVYTVLIRNGVTLFVKQDLVVDDLMKFPDSKSDEILTEISEFWNKGDLFKEYGFLHRRGYILYGPQGSGKTAIVQQVIGEIIEKGGIVFICEHPAILTTGLTSFRQVEPDRPVVCLFEDIDAIIKNYGDDYLLTLLDGENQIDKVLNIATTNYPEYLDKRIVSRPRRFDRVIKVGMPSADIRRAYFTKKLNIKEHELETWVNATEGFSFAACAELVISVKCLGHPFDKAVGILSSLLTSKASSNEFNEGQFGFAPKRSAGF